jgi:predicted nucleic acid-binding protein
VNQLDLYNYEPEELRVYEPFAGAAVFLVSALRHLRERLPVEWTDPQRHEFLVQRIAGDEIDAFACEVATLSLILADYPNRNGWKVHTTNLFEDGLLAAKMRAHNVVLCNPPFEAFLGRDSKRPIAKTTHSQAVAALNAALDAHPLALGFILPRAFVVEQQFSEQRRRIEKLYGAVELVELPDRMFRFSKVEASLLIAREPRPPASPLIKLRSTEVRVTTEKLQVDENDLWICAQARERNLTLITTDEDMVIRISKADPGIKFQLAKGL